MTDPTPALTAATGTAWDVFSTSGPYWGAVLAAYLLLSTFLSKQHWLAQGRLLSVLTGASMLLTAVVQWRFGGAPSAGILTAAMAAFTLVLHPTVGAAKPGSTSPAAGLLLLVLGLLTGPQLACSAATAKGAAKAGLADVVSCTTADRQALYEQFGPTMEQAIQRATGSDGKIDFPSLNSVTASLKADGWCVAERVAAQLIAAVLKHIPGAPMSAAAPLDAQDLAAKIAALRVAKFGATRFEIGAPPAAGP